MSALLVHSIYIKKNHARFFVKFGKLTVLVASQITKYRLTQGFDK
jgi:hypothetical protein